MRQAFEMTMAALVMAVFAIALGFWTLGVWLWAMTYCILLELKACLIRKT